MTEQDISDEMLAQIAAKAGGIQPLLDTFFSFLERKTDFYVQFDPTDKSKQSYKMGFPVGRAEKMVLQAFHKYRLKDYADVVGPEPPKIEDSGSSTTPTKAKPANGVPSTPLKTPSAPVLPPSTPVATVSKSSAFTPSYTPEGKQVPIGNGGIGDNYYWTQTLKDITIYIDIAAGCRSKDVKCVIKPQSLTVVVRGTTVIDGALEDVVRVDESMWTISSTTETALQQIVVTLDKTRQTWWKHVIVGHEEIDTNKVDSTQNIGEYDETTQAAIRKIMFEQKMKLQGSPPRPEMSEADHILERARYLPGSPL